MANTPVPNKLMANPDPLPPTISRGDEKWESMIRAWIAEGKPGQMVIGNYAYAVLQDPQTADYYFRPVDPKALYESRSL